MKTSWEELGLKLGTIKYQNGKYKGEIGSSEFAKEAIENILGNNWIKETTEYAISFKPGAELAMNCLKLIASLKAAEHAYSTYKNSGDQTKKSNAVWLIKHLKTKESYKWVEEFINDENVAIWGLGLLDQLLWSEIIDYEEEKERVDYLINLASKKNDPLLDENISFIRNYLKERYTPPKN